MSWFLGMLAFGILSNIIILSALIAKGFSDRIKDLEGRIKAIEEELRK